LGLLALALAGGAGGILLTVTNVESIALTSQGTLVAAIAVAASFGVARQKFAQIWLGVGASLWLVVGGFAAWQGSRVLYSRNDFDRSTFKRMMDPPEALRYLEGVRLDAGLAKSLRLLAADLERVKERDGDLSHVWFGPTLEWLERPYPETIVPGMPIWYHVGTALRRSDGPWLIESLQEQDIELFYVHPGWEDWPIEFENYLSEFYRRTSLGILKVYERRSATMTASRSLQEFLQRDQVLAMSQRIGSTVHLGTTSATAEDSPALYTSPWGEYYGARGDWTWRWLRGARDSKATFVITGVEAMPSGSTATAKFRVVADPDGERKVLHTGQVTVTAEKPMQRSMFEFNAWGAAVVFEVEVAGAAAAAVRTGWRDVRVLQAGDADDSQPPPGLQSPIAAVREQAADGTLSWWRWMGEIDENSRGPQDGTTLPFEIWTPGPSDGSDWHATLSIEPRTPSAGVVPIVMLVWFKSGRFEILDQFAPPVETGEFSVRGRMPEGDGWIGVAVRAVETGQPLHSRLKFLRWSE
jgi:hypothetical protein